MKIRNLSIKTNLFLASLTHICLIGAIGIIGLLYINSTIKASDRAYEETVLELQKLFELKIDLEDTRRLVLTLMSESHRSQQEQLLIKIDESESRIENNLTTMLSPDTPFDIEARPMLAAFRSTWQEFRNTREKELIPAILDGQISVAKNISHETQEPKFQTLLSIITDLIEHEEAETLAAHRIMDDNFHTTVVYYILFAAAGLLVIILMHMFISKPVGIRLNKIVDAMGNVKTDNFGLKLNIEKMDEIGMLSESFNHMLEHLDQDKLLREHYISALKSKSDELAEKNQRLEESLSEISRKNKEVEESRAHMVQSEKMASIGLLAAGVAHEINNPIGFVKSNLNTLSQYSNDTRELFDILSETNIMLKDGKVDSVIASLDTIQSIINDKDFEFVITDMQQLINESREGIDRVASIVRGLREFSHKEEDKFSSINLNDCLDNAIKVGWNEIKYRAEIVKEYGQMPMVECHPQQMHQVFLNIIINAANAMKDKGKIVITTFTEGNNAVVVIKDNGSGMDQETQKKIFEPFFTTKPVGRGTGLGLYVAYKIIKTHNGTIEVVSTPGEGTTFTVKVPIKSQEDTLVGSRRIELRTRGFSGLCSTD